MTADRISQIVSRMRLYRLHDWADAVEWLAERAGVEVAK